MRIAILLILAFVGSLLINPLFGVWHVPILGTLPIALIISGVSLANILLAALAMGLFTSVPLWIILIALGVTSALFLTVQKFVYIRLKISYSIIGFISRIFLGLIWYGLFTLVILILTQFGEPWAWQQWMQTILDWHLILGTFICMMVWQGLITILDL